METEDSTKEEFDANSNDLNVSSEGNISQNPLVFSYGEKLTNSNLETLGKIQNNFSFFKRKDIYLKKLLLLNVGNFFLKMILKQCKLLLVELLER